MAATTAADAENLTDPLLRGAARLRSAPPLEKAAALAIGPEDVAAAAERVAKLTNRTPVLTCRTIDDLVFGNDEGRILFKCENFQRVGAFKFRGACNAVAAVLERKREEAGTSELAPVRFVTESSGNHGQGLALAAKLQGHPAVVVVPNDAPKVKVEAMEGYGAEVVQVPPEERKSECQRVVAETNGTLVHPSNEPLVMAGQGTAFLELWEQAVDLGVEQLDVIITPVGGGGLLSGVAVAAKAINPDILVIAGEPLQANDAYNSLKGGEHVGHANGAAVAKSIAGGLLTILGSNTWPVVRDLVDDIICVTEEEIASAMKLVMERMKIVIEPSSAVAVAALMRPEFQALRQERGLKNVGVVLTGGNVDLTAPLPFLQS